MDPTLEQMARSLIESGDYRVTSRLRPQDEYHPPDNLPKLVAAVVDVETTGTNPDSDMIIELGLCLFEYDRQSGRIYKILGSWEWFEDPGLSIPAEITKITGITDEMVAGHGIDERAVNDLLSRWCSSLPATRISTAASWRNGFQCSPTSIGRAPALILTGKQRASVRRRSNSSPTAWPL
jgi:Exonuclease